MGNEERRFRDDEPGIDLIGLVKSHGRSAVITAAMTAGLVAVVAVVYFLWLQPVRRASVLEFRPTFDGATDGKYPNGLVFAPSDVTAAPIIDLVHDANLISEYCSREEFRGGFFVEQRSDQSAFLDVEYQSRLSDPRITAVERQSLQEEYEAKRETLPVHFRLVFVRPKPCAEIPQVVLAKAMTDVLLTWASESEKKRGVLNHQVELLTPAIMDVGLGDESSRLLRADLIRTALGHVVENINTVMKIPGAALVRVGEARTTFAEVRNRVIDLIRSRLEPLVVNAGRGMVREAVDWVADAAASAEREQQAAEGRADAYLAALREYSGMAQPSLAGDKAGAQASDVQTISPQIDRSFIDRIIQMSEETSEANTEYRQELTALMIDADLNAITARERASYYRRLLQTLREPGNSPLSQTQVDARLDEIVVQAKALIADFNKLYDEFSRVSLRPAGEMYQTGKPVTSEDYREFALRELLMLVVGVFFVTLLLAFTFFVLRDRLSQATAT